MLLLEKALQDLWQEKVLRRPLVRRASVCIKLVRESVFWTNC